MTTNLTPPDREPEEPDLQPPDAGQDPPRKGNLLFILLVAFTLFVLLDLAIIAYLLFIHKTEKMQLPVRQQEQFVKIDEVSGDQQPGEGPSPVDSEALRAAEELRRKWLQLEAMAEADDIRTWGGGDFTKIIDKAADGERFLFRKEYVQAGESFQQATITLEQLQAQKPALLAEALQAGKEALAAENSAAASEYFTRALALSPGNQQAIHGLARAQTLDQVLALYQEGLDGEEQADFIAAQAPLIQAQDLDPEFIPAAQALARVRVSQEDVDFREAMGGFLQALTAGKVEVAKKELNRAARLRPQSPAVVDGRTQLQQLTLEQTLARLQQEYVQFVSTEQWQQARERCEQALQVDPQASFALIGLQAAIRRLELDQALQSILNHSQRLQEQGPLEDARQTLAAAESVADPGPRLREQVTAVRKQLQAAIRQVLVVVQSDNATEVVIYRVGRLGRFNRRELQLRPGRYTVVGSRPGYRDVRKVFEVQAGDEQAHLRIRCEEVI